MARYKEAIEWIAYNDDTEFLNDPYTRHDETHVSVSVALVADIFGKTRAQARADLVKQLKRMERFQLCHSRDIPE